jgi:hypothetical protein
MNRLVQFIAVLNLSTLTLLPDFAFAQSREVICGDTTYARVRTRNFYVNICGNSSHPTQYVGTSKSGQAIVLPLSSYRNGRFVAANGNTRYILTRESLTVTQGGRRIMNERVTQWLN